MCQPENIDNVSIMYREVSVQNIMAEPCWHYQNDLIGTRSMLPRYMPTHLNAYQTDTSMYSCQAGNALSLDPSDIHRFEFLQGMVYLYFS